jgi:integrase
MNGEDEVVLLIGFLMYTGARRHEAMNSEWQHINLGDKDWYVPITKSGKPRHIVLNGKAIEITAQKTWSYHAMVICESSNT